ncbi:hypothetical protein [Streptomyces celluloflavus]|uniref:hypothetical protein n=1 Tax=Streptomyces celluloflavus TaxID=58344 RepID=UPI0036954AAA
MPTTAAVSRARVKLGPKPLRVLFAEVAKPLATEENQGTWYGRWRLITIDGADLARRPRSLRHDTADTAQLDADRLSFTRSIRSRTPTAHCVGGLSPLTTWPQPWQRVCAR